LRRLVVLSSLLILGGLLLLLPSSPLVAHLTSSTPSGSTTVGGFGVTRSSSATSDTTGTVESMLGFGLIGVGLVLEILSLFTDVGMAFPGEGVPGKAEARLP
jgi:hypothetical protein